MGFYEREELKRDQRLLCLFFYISEGRLTCMTSSSKLECKFQAGLVKELKKRFVGCVILKLDANYIQGIPDLLILWKDKWAALECKRDARAKKRPNQEYYVGLLNKMSFSRFISPENKEEVLNELQQAFKS